MNMSDIDAAIGKAAANVAMTDNAWEEIFLRHFGLSDKGKDPEDAGLMAYGLSAVDVAKRLMNLFVAIKNPNSNRAYTAICDLTFQLNTNVFWQKNASVLMPILHVTLNTHRDGVALQLERAKREEYAQGDTLLAASRAAPLEIFPVIAYLFGGPDLMLSASLPLKQELAPYLLS